MNKGKVRACQRNGSKHATRWLQTRTQQLNKNNQNIDWNPQFLFYFMEYFSTYLVASRFKHSRKKRRSKQYTQQWQWLSYCRSFFTFLHPFICSENKEITTIEIVSFNGIVGAAIFIALYSIFDNIIFNKSFVARARAPVRPHTPSHRTKRRKNLSFAEWNGI